MASKCHLEDSYLHSEQHHVVQEKLEVIMTNLLTKEKEGKGAESSRVSYATNVFWQVCARSGG